MNLKKEISLEKRNIKKLFLRDNNNFFNYFINTTWIILTGKINPLAYIFYTAIYMFSWEFIFRGFLLFGLANKFKEGSILIQTIPFAILHLGKPALEAFFSVFGGIYLGYICYKSRSLIPAFLIHFSIKIILIFMMLI